MKLRLSIFFVFTALSSCTIPHDNNPIIFPILSRIVFIEGDDFLTGMTFEYNELQQLVKTVRNGIEDLYFYEDNKLVKVTRGSQNTFYEYNLDGLLIKVDTDGSDWVKTYEYIGNEIHLEITTPSSSYAKVYTMVGGNNVDYRKESSVVITTKIVYDSNPSFLGRLPYAYALNHTDLNILFDGFINSNNPISTDFQTITYVYNASGYPILLTSKAVDPANTSYSYIWKLEY